MTRFGFIFAAIVWSTSLALGSEADRQRQVEAARIAAQAKIVDLISDEPLGRSMTVGAFLDRMNARQKLWQTVSVAQQVGGARWIDDGACQVRVEVRAADVGQLMLDLVTASPNKSPLSYDTIEQRVKQWNNRSFSATGGSLSAERAIQVAPPKDSRDWAKVDDARRRQTIDLARANAGSRFVQEFVTNDMADEPARAKLVEWATSQPVTAVQFRDDQTVDVTIAVSPQEFSRVVQSVQPEANVQDLDRRLEAAPPTFTGSSRADSVNSASPQVVVIPAQAPDWAAELIDVSGEATFKSSALKTARRADDAAEQAMREAILALPLDGRKTVADRGKTDPAIAAAIDRAITSARVAKVDYRADGSVAVRLVLPGKTVWRELTTDSDAMR